VASELIYYCHRVSTQLQLTNMSYHIPIYIQQDATINSLYIYIYIWKLLYMFRVVESGWNVMAHGDTRKGKWRGNWRMEWVSSTFHTTSEHGVSNITTAVAHTSAASSRLNWRPRRFKWTRPFRRKTKSGFCACAITFQTQCTSTHNQERIQLYLQHLVLVKPLLLPAAIAAGSSNGLTNTRCCRYSCMRSWLWVEVPPETIYWNIFTMDGPTKFQKI